MKCKHCNKEHNGSFGSGKFCNKSCANSRIQTKEMNKKRRRKLKGRSFGNKFLKGNKNYNISKYPDIDLTQIKYCKCGCRQRIKINEKHKYDGIPNYIQGHNSKSGLNMKNYKYSKEIKRKLREAKIKQIEKQYNAGLPSIITIGKYETQILNYLEDKIGDKIIRQYKVAGYFLDGYSKLRNITFEIDEPYHLTEKQIIKDKSRQQEIEEELRCIFVRIKVPD